MASSPDFVEYVCDQIGGAGSIAYKKMFGEYGIYCDGKVIGVICDNQMCIRDSLISFPFNGSSPISLRSR